MHSTLVWVSERPLEHRLCDSFQLCARLVLRLREFGANDHPVCPGVHEVLGVLPVRRLSIDCDADRTGIAAPLFGEGVQLLPATVLDHRRRDAVREPAVPDLDDALEDDGAPCRRSVSADAASCAGFGYILTGGKS